MGQFNLMSAQANSINTDTAIRLNEYEDACIKNGSKELAERNAATRAKEKEEYNKLHERYLENPENLDVMSGNALNAVLNDLMNPKISDSSFRYAEVPLPVNVVRRIPFKLAEKRAIFSMSRLSLRSKTRWPMAFRGSRFDLDRQAYERALDHVLEEAIEGKLQVSAIDALGKAVDDLERKLNDQIGASSDPVYRDAKKLLNELQSSVDILKHQKVERTLGEIDRYSGTTVNDLRLFMRQHSLTFAPADSPEEKKLYPELHASLVQQREKLSGATQPPEK